MSKPGSKDKMTPLMRQYLAEIEVATVHFHSNTRDVEEDRKALYEGFGIPLLESMACGSPIVASRIPATVEVAGEVPTYFEPGDYSSLIDALNRVVDSGRNNPAIGQGLAHARTYSWGETARLVLGAYTRLLR